MSSWWAGISRSAPFSTEWIFIRLYAVDVVKVVGLREDILSDVRYLSSITVKKEKALSLLRGLINRNDKGSDLRANY